MTTSIQFYDNDISKWLLFVIAGIYKKWYELQFHAVLWCSVLGQLWHSTLLTVGDFLPMLNFSVNVPSAKWKVMALWPQAWSHHTRTRTQTGIYAVVYVCESNKKASCRCRGWNSTDLLFLSVLYLIWWGDILFRNRHEDSGMGSFF